MTSLIVEILPLRRPAKSVTAAPLFRREVVIAPDDLQTQRLAICGACQFNVKGVCRQCCGGVPVRTLVRLAASRCGRLFW